MFRFANPHLLYLFILAPFLIIGFMLMNIRKRKDVKKIGDMTLVKQMMPELSLKRSYLKFWLTLIILGIGVILLARPQFGTKVDKVDKKGIEMVVAIDVSNSMLSQDIKPSRLQKAKQMLTQIINKSQNDKMAIVVFAGESFIQMPLTTDVESAKLFLNSINPNLVPVQGTAIGDAINTSMKCFSNDKKAGKSLILITDGETFDGDPKAAAASAAAQGIQINVVGIGTTQGGVIPLQEGSSDVKRDSKGMPVVTKLNETVCKEIAEAGKGMYTHADNSDTALKALQNQLKKLKKSDIKGVSYSNYDEKFPVFAWIILILLFVEVCVFDKKNRIFRNIKLFK